MMAIWHWRQEFFQEELSDGHVLVLRLYCHVKRCVSNYILNEWHWEHDIPVTVKLFEEES